MAFVQFLLDMFYVFTLLGGSTCGGYDKSTQNFNWKPETKNPFAKSSLRGEDISKKRIKKRDCLIKGMESINVDRVAVGLFRRNN
jgi:hypothetical protein